MGNRDDEFEQYAAQAFPRLCRSGYLVCGDWQRAEDAAQETLLRLHGRWGRLRNAGSIDAYARRTLLNLLVDASRRPWRREVLTDPGEPEASPDEHRVHDRDEAVRALAGLTQRQRTCLVLRFYLDCSVAETAELLGCSTGNVSRLTSDALAALDRTTERTMA